MTRQIITYNEIEGVHYYQEACEPVAFLANKHRHIFVIRGFWNVTHNNREIEIIIAQRQVEKKLHQFFGVPCDFAEMSCESIAEWLLDKFTSLSKVEVLEDGYGGATLTR